MYIEGRKKRHDHGYDGGTDNANPQECAGIDQCLVPTFVPQVVTEHGNRGGCQAAEESHDNPLNGVGHRHCGQRFRTDTPVDSHVRVFAENPDQFGQHQRQSGVSNLAPHGSGHSLPPALGPQQPHHGDDNADTLRQTGHQRTHTSADKSQTWRSEIAEDEHPIEKKIDEDRGRCCLQGQFRLIHGSHDGRANQDDRGGQDPQSDQPQIRGSRHLQVRIRSEEADKEGRRDGAHHDHRSRNTHCNKAGITQGSTDLTGLTRSRELRRECAHGSRQGCDHD